MTIKNMLLTSLISASFFMFFIANAHSTNVQELLESSSPEVQQDYEEWYDSLSIDAQKYLESNEKPLFLRITTLHLLQSPEYQEWEKFEAQIDQVRNTKVVFDRLCGDKTDSIWRFFDPQCKEADKLQKKLQIMNRGLSKLDKKVNASSEWKAYAQARESFDNESHSAYYGELWQPFKRNAQLPNEK